jgi:hypothetical protein
MTLPPAPEPREYHIEGRTYDAVTLWQCRDCLARLDDDQGIAVHQAWHALRKADMDRWLFAHITKP